MMLPCRPVCIYNGTIVKIYNKQLDEVNDETITSSTERLTDSYEVISLCYMQKPAKSCCVCLSFVGNRDNANDELFLPNSRRVDFGELARNNFFTKLLDFCKPFPNSPMNESCPICLDAFTRERNILLLRCSHCYHERCIVQWICTKNSKISSKSCPLCKDTLSVDNLSINSYFTSFSSCSREYGRFSVYRSRLGILLA